MVAEHGGVWLDATIALQALRGLGGPEYGKDWGVGHNVKTTGRFSKVSTSCLWPFLLELSSGCARGLQQEDSVTILQDSAWRSGNASLIHHNYCMVVSSSASNLHVSLELNSRIPTIGSVQPECASQRTFCSTYALIH